jgi:hypothetical protein
VDCSSEVLDEAFVDHRTLERRKCGEVDANAGLDVRDREPGERMADDDCVRLRPDRAGVVERRQADLVARQIGSRDLVAAILELLGQSAEAPPAVPASVQEHEPCHRASIQHCPRGCAPTPLRLPAGG